MLVGMACMPPIVVSSGSQIYDTAGSYTFTVPAGVSSIDISTVGGAGGGASGWTSVVFEKGGPVYTPQYGGDGGTGASANKVLPVSPFDTVFVVVGSGGSGGSAPGVDVYGTLNAGDAGTDSVVTHSAVTVASADGGTGGGFSDGAGGLASASIGDTKTDGVTGAGGAGGYGNTNAGDTGVDGSVTITW